MAKKTSSRKAGDKKTARATSRPAAATRKAAVKAAPRTAVKPAAKAAKPKAVAKTKAAKPAAKPALSKPPAVQAPPILPKGKIKSPLSKKELVEFRTLLLAKRRTLVGDMNGMEAEAFRANRQENSSDLSTMPVHMADIGTDNYEQEFTLGLLESERQLLREINEALDRIEKGTFGVCLGTGAPIAIARMKAKPWAKYCIDYARQLEQGLIRPPAPAASTGPEEEDDDAEGDEPAEEEEEAEVDIEEELAAQEAEDDLSL